MCGRFVISATQAEIEEYLSISISVPYHTNYNTAPSQEVYVISSDEPKIVTAMQWGFIPHWADRKTFKFKSANARSESVATKPMFREAFKNNRCVLLASGYFEWQETNTGKQPFYIYQKEVPVFPIAGIWSEDSNNNRRTCALLTQDAKNNLAEIHDRRPVILNPKYISHWLNPELNNSKEIEKI